MFGLAVEEPENLVQPLLMENSPGNLEILSGVLLFNFQLWTTGWIVCINGVNCNEFTDVLSNLSFKEREMSSKGISLAFYYRGLPRGVLMSLCRSFTNPPVATLSLINQPTCRLSVAVILNLCDARLKHPWTRDERDELLHLVQENSKSSYTPTHERTFISWHDNRKQETDCLTTVEWFVDFVMVYWHSDKGIMLPGNDATVEKSKAKTCRFVESKNGLLLSQIVALFLSVFVSCQWIRKRLSPHFWAVSPVTKTSWKASLKPIWIPHVMVEFLSKMKSLHL